RSRWREGDLPLAETVLAFVPAELCLLPGVAAIVGEIDPSDACIAAKSYSARRRRGTGLQGVARLDVGDEGTRNHSGDRHQSKVVLSRLHVGTGCIGDSVGRCCPVIRIGLV